MHIILYIAGLIAAILIVRLFVVKNLPKQAGFKDILDEILNEPYGDEDSDDSPK